MQLNERKSATYNRVRNNNVAGVLAAATAILVGPSVKAEGDFWDFSKDWRFDSAVLYYGEQDRVSALEGVFSATREVDVKDVFNFKVVLDSLTGASPSGAIVQPGEQTFTRPSGNGQYIVSAEEIPLDDTFRDTRLQLNAQWTKAAWGESTGSYGIHFSKEYDYLSLAFNGSLAWDFNKKNSTFSVGLSIANDTFEPVGKIPDPFSSMVIDFGQFPTEDDYRAAFNATRIDSSDDKQTTDLLLGWTQVINRSTIMQFNYSYSNVSGYLNDPFKIISTVDGGGIATDHLFESRPDKRTKHSFFWQTKHHFDESIADVSIRYMTDNWDISSQTIDYRHYFWVGNNSYIEPQMRWYQQSAAEFYRPYLIDGETLPEYASADIRLGEFSAYTLGLKYGWKTSAGNDMSVRFSYYKQTPEDTLSSHPGVLNNLEIYPELDAFFVQYSYSF
ncbi:DUF3570 domain-containing protein [Pleionea sediminis]|uniref:DUF3570 domain-containing protein n=1 Tax=Pleionea sediminis TaxID=2569479 RepID=UPI0011867C0F|nr:DUF3570 domain-containing protein [Pleionea sediminis]